MSRDHHTPAERLAGRRGRGALDTILNVLALAFVAWLVYLVLHRRRRSGSRW